MDPLIVVTPIHPASYTTLMTIPAADVRTPIVAVSPIAIVPIGTVAVVAIWAIAIAIIAIGTMGIAVVAVPAAVISTAISTPLNSAVDAGNAPGR